jgi:mannosyltransferase
MLSSVHTEQSFLRRHEGLLWLLLIVLTGAALRFYGLTYQSYWFDELFSAYYSDPAHSLNTVIELTFADVHPPLYQVVMWASYKLLGYTEWAGRLPSALAGTLMLPLIYLLGREFFNRRVGLYAAALAVPNYYLLYYSQEARSYALLYLLCGLSLLFFIRALRKAEIKNVVAFVISSIALAYTHYFGFILLVAETLMLLMWLRLYGQSDRRLLMRAGIAAAVIIVGILPLINIIVGHSAIEEFWIQQPGPAFLINYFILYFYSPLIAVGVFILLLTGMSRLFVLDGWPKERFAVCALLIWVVLGYFLPWLRGLLGQPVLTDRNTIMLLPAMLLLAAYGLTLLPNLRAQRALGAALIIYSVYFLLGPLTYYTAIKKNQYREITRALDVYQPVWPLYTLEYNDTKYNVYFKQMDSDLAAIDYLELEKLLTENKAPAMFWLADGFGRRMQTDIDERFGLIETDRLNFRGVTAVLYSNPAGASPNIK